MGLETTENKFLQEYRLLKNKQVLKKVTYLIHVHNHGSLYQIA
jgi:hypothetical protein